MTPAVHLMRANRIAFTPHLYPFEEHGGTRHAAACLQVDEHSVIKTLVMENDQHKPILVLMHGDREASTKQLARLIGSKRVSPAEISDAQRYTGYTVGGISPFGTRTRMPLYVEQTILELERIFVNGGRRGFLVEIDPQDLRRALPVVAVSIAT